METRGLADRSPGWGIPAPVNSNPRRNRWWLALFWLAAPVLLFGVLRQVPLSQAWDSLSRLSVWQVSALALTNLVVLLLMTARWALVIRALGERVPLTTLLAYRLAGFGVSYFTPGPQFGGEPLQVHLLHRWQGLALDRAIASVFLDRLVDLLANFTFLAVGILVVLLAGLGGAWLGPGAWVFVLGLLFFPLGHLLALRAGKRPAAGLLSYLANRTNGRWKGLEKAADLSARAESQVRFLLLERPLVFAAIIGTAGLTWLVMIFEFWLSLRFLGVTATVQQTIAALTAARLAFLLPLPAGLGALEAGETLAAGLLGWDPAVGIALSLVIRARDIFFALLGLGLGSWPSLQSWIKLRDRKERI
jgi:glycosyltransferase 2 family protein